MTYGKLADEKGVWKLPKKRGTYETRKEEMQETILVWTQLMSACASES
jgi:hypothetical protein